MPSASLLSWPRACSTSLTDSLHMMQSTSSAFVWAVLCRYGMIEHATCKDQRNRVVLLVGGKFIEVEEAPEDEEGEFVETVEESGSENDEDDGCVSTALSLLDPLRS